MTFIEKEWFHFGVAVGITIGSIGASLMWLWLAYMFPPCQG